MDKSFSRHDMPETVKVLLESARLMLPLDSFDIYELAVQHGNDWHALTETICEYAHAKRHMQGELHADIVKKAEKVWQTIGPTRPAPAVSTEVPKTVSNEETYKGALEWILSHLYDAHGRQCVIYNDTLGPDDDNETVVQWLKRLLGWQS